MGPGASPGLPFQGHKNCGAAAALGRRVRSPEQAAAEFQNIIHHWYWLSR